MTNSHADRCAAGGRTVYSITFDTSSTGGAVHGSRNSAITITFPSGTGLTQRQQLADPHRRQRRTSATARSTRTPSPRPAQFFNNETVAAGARAHRPARRGHQPTGQPDRRPDTVTDGPDHLGHRPPVTASFTVAATNQISQPVVSLSNAAPAPARSRIPSTFTTSSTGGLSTLANSAITITFPSGTGLTNVNSSSDPHRRQPEHRGLLGQPEHPHRDLPILQQRNRRRRRTPHRRSSAASPTHRPRAPRRCLVQTTSDPTSVTSGPYNIGGQPPAPAVTGISPVLGADGGRNERDDLGHEPDRRHRGQLRIQRSDERHGPQRVADHRDLSPGSGTVDVTVTTPGGTSATGAADRFTYNAHRRRLPRPPSSPPAVSGGAPTTQSQSSAAAVRLGQPGEPGHDRVLRVRARSGISRPGRVDDPVRPVDAGAAGGLRRREPYRVRLAGGAGAGGALPRPARRDQQRRHHVRHRSDVHDPGGPRAGAAGSRQDRERAAGQRDRVHPVGVGAIRAAHRRSADPLGRRDRLAPRNVEADDRRRRRPGGARDAAAKGKRPKTTTQSGTFGGAIFKVTQARAGASKGLVTLTLVEGAFNGAPSYALCTKHKAGDASAAAVSSKVLQLLHASAHGKFRTERALQRRDRTRHDLDGRRPCDGTLTHDITDSVAVNDFVRHKTIILHAGQSYLAKASSRTK